MNYRYLADTGVMVSPLAFGTMSFGGDADEETSRQLFHRCREAGINHFDTAADYGVSELRLGAWMPQIRDRVFDAPRPRPLPRSTPSSTGSPTTSPRSCVFPAARCPTGCSR